MKQGEIWDIKLGSKFETSKRMARPVVVINDDTIGVLPSRVIVPLTDWQDKFDDAIWLVRVDPDDENNLGKISAADAFQLHSIPTARFVKKVGTISDHKLRNIKDAVKAIINVD